ncbi:MAG: lysophospholipid acyltransferase family protein [Proteobacteria bacterium]|nr:lysophospholipid acyltransferase family protein [Pseudomonadota bacterium]
MRSTLALTLGRPYLRWSARTRLDGVFATGLEHAREALAAGPVVFAANHVSWWDGPLGVLADAETGAESLFLVDSVNLSRVGFLRWFGAIPLDRTSPLTARHGLKHAVSWLDGAHKAVWIYPQGRQRPAHLRPLELARGWDFVARRSSATVIPVAMQYGFREDHRPAAALSFGRANPTQLEAALQTQLDELDAFFDGRHELAPLVGPPTHRVDAGIGARLLAMGAKS